MPFPDVLDDGLVHGVAAHPNRAPDDHAGQGNDRDVGRSTTDVDDHVASGVGNWQTGTNGGRHRLVD